jgi:hypothetical protein
MGDQAQAGRPKCIFRQFFPAKSPPGAKCCTYAVHSIGASKCKGNLLLLNTKCRTVTSESCSYTHGLLFLPVEQRTQRLHYTIIIRR